MAFWGDYHTHSVYSHGKGTIEQNVRAAIKAGLKELAITDHGFKYLMCNVRRREWKKITEDVESVRAKYPQIKLELGLETNFNSTKGYIDIKQSDVPLLDLIICGYHKFVIPYKLRDIFTFFWPNFFLDTFGKSSKRMTAKNTDAYIKALERYDIDIIAHMNSEITVDAVEVAKAAAHYGTLIELNGKRINLTDTEIEKIVDAGAELICVSDAHSPEKVGDFSRGAAVIERLGIPYEKVANWERIPDFRSKRAKREKANGG
ncbi:MAG: PHP domain-containing protein [Clostridiales bacterium]|jgi:putative hydrolase|nr:PHP domain-containing protein [Clostridiales bacterium]